MHSKQELIETAVLNYLVKQSVQLGKTNRKEIQENLVSLGLVRPSKSPTLNSVKVLVLNLQNRFKKLGIPLLEQSAVIANEYTVSYAAFEYCREFLTSPLYDEEGILVGEIIQHPIVLDEEREMLI